MRRTLTFCLVVISALCVGAVSASQAKPNFSGQWVPQPGNPDDILVIAHSEKEIRISRLNDVIPHVAAYALDGTEKRELIGALPNQIVKSSKAEWSGNQVIITETTDRPDKSKMERNSAWSLDADGQLIWEATLTGVPQGPAKARIVYRKK